MLLANDSVTIDNTEGSAPMEGELGILSLLTIPENAGWLFTGQLQLQLQIFFVVTTNVANSKPNSERFLNPTQSQIGHWSLSAKEFVLDDGRLKYSRQAIRLDSPLIPITSTTRDAPISLSLTRATRRSSIQGSGNAVICGTGSAISQANGQEQLTNVSMLMPQEQLRSDLIFGQMQFRQENNLRAGVKELLVDTSRFLWPDTVSIIAWQGQQVEILWSIEDVTIDSTAENIPLPSFIVGDSVTVPYGYACDRGLVRPAITNPPCLRPDLIYTDTGTGALAAQRCARVVVP